MIGVIIEKGASDWQIFQQENGYARVPLEGHYVRNHNPEKEEGYGMKIGYNIYDKVKNFLV